jgi:polar amino acid transport system substrate-binding protein
MGVELGDSFDIVGKNVFSPKEIRLFSTMPEIFAALDSGQIGVTLFSSVYIASLKDSGTYDKYDYYALPSNIYEQRSANVFATKELRDEFNAWLEKMRASGEYQKMFDFWTKNAAPAASQIPHYTYTGEKGVLRICDTNNYMPLSYIGPTGECIGFGIDFARRFCAENGYTPDFSYMEYNAILPYITSGKADMTGCAFEITAERQNTLILGDPSIIDSAVLAVKKNLPMPAGDKKSGEMAKTSFNFINWFKNSVNKNLILENRWQLIVDGLGVTVKIALLSELFGTLLACPLCWFLTRKNRFTSGLGVVYCKTVAGLPMLTFMLVFYYIIFARSNIDPVLIAVSAFAIVSAAGIARTLKGAIDMVDVTEIEAARAIGFTGFSAFRLIVLPQALKRALPSYMASFVELVKGTAIVGYIAIKDLTRAGDIIRSRTFDAYFPILFSAAIYFVITLALTELFKLIIKMIDRKGGAAA